jgi:Bacterial regulatory helix-turn-helix protein, lysR family
VRIRAQADAMEMHQVRYFLALCEERNFIRAARRCGVAQPSLSRAIKQMEAELGGSLFDRDRAQLSDLGVLVRPELARIDRSAAETKRKAAKFLAGRSVIPQPRVKEALMRVHHVIAVIVVLVIGVGVKQFFFPATQAEADVHAAPSASMNVLQAQTDYPNIKNLPAQKMHDMTFVFADGD